MILERSWTPVNEILQQEQWWLIGGSLVATPDFKPAVPGSNPAISPAYHGLPILGWAAIWDGTPLQAVLWGAAEENKYKKGTSGPPKTNKEKKDSAGWKTSHRGWFFLPLDEGSKTYGTWFRWV
jgi:hypothetical protein